MHNGGLVVAWVGEGRTGRVRVGHADERSDIRRPFTDIAARSDVHVVLRSAFAQAQRWGWVWDNPVERAHRIVVPPREMRPPTPAELRRLLEHIATVDVMFHVFVLLAAITGARRSQLLGLRWDDVTHATMRVSFRSGWVEGPDGPTLAATKTKRSHSVDLDPHTYQCLITSASDHQAFGFVFSDDGGVTAWKPNRVTKTFVSYRRAVGLREFRLHDLRHFMATEMLDAGIPLPVVSRRLDHQRASTTLNLYAHAVPGPDAPAAQLLHRIIHNPVEDAAELTESMHDLTSVE